MSMQPIFDPICLSHDTGAHPESARRLATAGFPERRVPTGEPQLTLVHSQTHIAAVRAACEQGQSIDADTVTCPASFEAAARAVGATLVAAAEGGFAISRPPGHHAAAERVSGFCLFNAVAIAARQLQQAGHRVMILDFDGHYGDGTAAIFAEDPEVLYCSLHQLPAFPGHGSTDEIGTGPGRGFTVNVPLPPGSGDDLMWHGLQHVLPVARAFAPDVVAVSAGFDAHWLDPLLDLQLTEHSFHKIGRLLADEFPSVFATLEGGYEPKALQRSIHAFLAGFNGEPLETTERATTSSIQCHSELDMRLCHLDASLAPFWDLR